MTEPTQAAVEIKEIDVTVKMPESSAKMSQALKKLTLDIMAAKKAGLTGAALVTAAVSAAIGDLAGALPVVGMLAKPFGVAKAFAVAGLDIAEELTGK
jgi:hypothetical protein